MTFRIYKKSTKEYLDDSWLLKNDNKIVEIRNHQMFFHKTEGFIIEPWTGYFDKEGKKIYCGDILEMSSMFDFKSKVIWESGGFWMVPIDPEGTTDAMRHAGHIRLWTIMGNIHNADF